MNEKVKIFYRELRNKYFSPDCKEWRFGQTVFNTMHMLYPAVADKFRGTSIDPFHNDDNMDEFIEKCFDELNAEIIESYGGNVTAETVGEISSGSGDVRCGSVSGSVKTGSGDVTCKSVNGMIRTGSGDVYHT